MDLRTLARRAATGAAAFAVVLPCSPTHFYTPPPDPGAVAQIAQLKASGQKQLAEKIHTMVSTPQAIWVTGGSGASLTASVKADVSHRDVPVLVAYNIPYRDCSQYSAGGASGIADYEAWIDAFAAGIGHHAADVMLEPDSLGIIPWYTNISGSLEWCQPATADPATAASDRFAEIAYAVQRLKSLPNVKVYLDGTHSAWLAVGDIASRLARAGVSKADGFFVNVSNYETTTNNLAYGDYISKCLYLGTYATCASQYDTDPAAWYAAHVGHVSPSRLSHFVVDTSRNGAGPWTAPAGNTWPDPQTWCNPPDRGLGIRPTTHTGDPLADAFLWIKTPGQSDGQCDRGTGTGVDPARGNTADPAAGAWFDQQAIELVENANPPLR